MVGKENNDLYVIWNSTFQSLCLCLPPKINVFMHGMVFCGRVAFTVVFVAVLISNTENFRAFGA